MAARTAEAHAAASDLELVAEREIDAPRELVWTAWTEPEHVARWWGPNGFTTTVERMDVRPGGTWSFVMHGPDGTDYPNAWTYVELARPERIVMDHASPPRFRMVATFAEREGRTTVRVRSIFPSAAERDRVVKVFHADEGLRETVANLAGYVAALRSGRR